MGRKKGLRAGIFFKILLVIAVFFIGTSGGRVLAKSWIEANKKFLKQEEKPRLTTTPTPKSKPKPTSTPRPTAAPKSTRVPTRAPTPSPTREWGVARQVAEHEWKILVGQDERMATPEETFEALNVYRQRHGSGALIWDGNLAEYAQTRAEGFLRKRKLDQHQGFREYVSNDENRRSLGFWGLGENAAYGTRLFGVHLIEWIFAGDEPHDRNQLNPQWTHVGIGISGTAVDLIFGRNKI